MIKNQKEKTVLLFSFFWLVVLIRLTAGSISDDVDVALNLLNSDKERCESFTIELLAKSKDSGDSYGLVKSNYILGYLKKTEGDFGKAVLYYLEGIRYAENAFYENSDKDFISLLQNTGNIFRKFGNYELAREYYSKAMALAMERNDLQKYTFLVFLTSRVFSDEKKYDEAISILESTYAHFHSIKKSTVAEIYNHLGIIYTDLGKKNEAITVFNKLLTFVSPDEKLEKKYGAWTYHNLANLYQESNNTDSAILFYRKAIDFKKSINASHKSLFLSLKDLGEAYLKIGNYDLAEVYLDEANLFLPNSKDVNNHYELFKFKSLVRRAKGDVEGYARYQDLYTSSLENYLSEQRKIEAADKKYNLDLITQRYFALVAEQERNQQIQYYSTVGGSFLVTLIVLIIAFFQYRKYRLRKDLEVSLQPFIKNTL